MVRFLLSNGNATYANGVFTFSLDQRLRNATRARFRKAAYVLASTASVAPNIVYLRSRALHSIAGNTHTVILTAAQHENAVDVMAVLEDTHTTGRYRMIEDPRVLPLTYSHLRDLDFYFTDPEGNNLSFTESAEDAVTAAAIAARADLFLFLNYTDATKVTIDESGTESLLTEIEAVNDSTFEFIPNSGSGIIYGDFGTNAGKCADFGGVDWVRLNDGSTVEEPETGTLSLLFQSQANTTDVQVLTDWYRWRIYVNAGGKLSYYDGAINETTITVENSTDYLVSIRRDNAVGEQSFTWRLEKLSDSTVQTDSTANGNNSGGTGLFDIGGNSSYSAAGHKTSNLVVITSIADADVLTVETYMKQYYRGLVSTSSGATSTDATWFAEIDIDTK